jgi:membrane protease YdiL (CAAX protease family)
MPWDFLAILLVLALVIPWRGQVRVRRLMAQPSVSPLERLTLYASTIAFQWIAVAIVAWRAWVRGMTPAALGLPAEAGLPITDPGRTATAAIVLTALLLAAQIIGLRQSARLPLAKRGYVQHLAEKLLPQTTVERLAFAALAATVGVCEEFLYRGFAFGLLFSLSEANVSGLPGWPLAFFGSALLFGLAHLYQGKKGIAATFVAGLLFAGARFFSGNLAPGIIAHTAVDLTAGLLAPRLLRPSPAPVSNQNDTIVTH